MTTQLIAAPTEEPVTLSELKSYLRVTHTDEDVSIARIGMAARHALEMRTGVCFVSQQWRMERDCAPNGPLKLPRSPVSSVDLVAVLNDAGSFEAVPSADYDYTLGVAARLTQSGYWPQPASSLSGIRIDFTAGWADAASVPAALKQAVLSLGAHFYEHREAASAERVFKIPESIDALMAPYKDVQL
ncbi:MAG: head-tail connector protein [Pseudomonadota bacterium]